MKHKKYNAKDCYLVINNQKITPADKIEIERENMENQQNEVLENEVTKNLQIWVKKLPIEKKGDNLYVHNFKALLPLMEGNDETKPEINGALQVEFSIDGGISDQTEEFKKMYDEALKQVRELFIKKLSEQKNIEKIEKT